MHFLNENCCIVMKVSLKFVSQGPIKNIPALVQIMAWYCPDDKSFSEPVMVSLLTHICITLPQWVNMNKILSWSLILTLIFWCYWLNIPILILELFETILNFSENFLSLRMPSGNPISSDLWKFHLPPQNPCWSSQLHVLDNFPRAWHWYWYAFCKIL